MKTFHWKVTETGILSIERLMASLGWRNFTVDSSGILHWSSFSKRFRDIGRKCLRKLRQSRHFTVFEVSLRTIGRTLRFQIRDRSIYPFDNDDLWWSQPIRTVWTSDFQSQRKTFRFWSSETKSSPTWDSIEGDELWDYIEESTL